MSLQPPPPLPELSELAAAMADSLGLDPPSTADTTTHRILSAGVAELREFGFRRTSMGNVAKRAGVARMTVYRRYPSKEALTRAVLSRQIARLMHTVNAEVDPALPFEVRWVEGFARTVYTVRRDRLLRRLLISDPEEAAVALTLSAGPLLELARALLAAFVQAHVRGIDAQQAGWTAESALRLLQSLLLTPSRTIDTDDLTSLRAYAQSQVLALVPKPRSTGR